MAYHWKFIMTAAKNWKYAVGIGALVAIGIWQGIKGVKLPSYVYWLVLVVTLYLMFFKTWKDEVDRREAVERKCPSPRRAELLRDIWSITEEYMELLRVFPNSDAVPFPFSKAWRPLVGDLDVPYHKQRMIAWYWKFIGFMDRLGDVEKGNQKLSGLYLMRVVPFGPCSSMECLIGLKQIEKLLIESVWE